MIRLINSLHSSAECVCILLTLSFVLYPLLSRPALQLTEDTNVQWLQYVRHTRRHRNDLDIVFFRSCFHLIGEVRVVVV